MPKIVGKANFVTGKKIKKCFTTISKGSIELGRDTVMQRSNAAVMLQATTTNLYSLTKN